MANATKPLAQDESINTTESTSRNIADVLAQELVGIKNAISGGGGGSGHTIITPEGTMPQRSNLNFTDAYGNDDSVDDETEVSVVKVVDKAAYDQMSESEKTQGFLFVQGMNPPYVPSDNCVSVTADGVKSHATLLDELLALADASKIGRNTVLVYAPPNGNINYCHIDRDTTSNGISFANTIIGLNNNNVVDYYFILKSGGCKYKERVNGSVTDNSTNAPSSGTVYILYYNIVASPVVETETFSITPETGITIASQECTREGNQTKVMFKVEFPSVVGENQEVVIGSIPAEYAPTLAVWAFTGSSYSFGAAFITTTGTIKFRAFHIYSTQYFNDANLCFVY